MAIKKRRTASELEWGEAALRRMQDAAGCAKHGCRLRYFGEMQTLPCQLFRHEAYDADRGVMGGDIRIDTYGWSRTTGDDVASWIVEALKRHHKRAYRKPDPRADSAEYLGRA